jgi:hypothetical protein
MPHSAGYQQLPQDVEETLVEEQSTEDRAKAARGRSARTHKPGHIDLRKLDNAFKRWARGLLSYNISLELTHVFRWTESIAQKVKRKKKVEDYSRKEIWQSVFEPCAPSFAVGSGSEFMVNTGFYCQNACSAWLLVSRVDSNVLVHRSKHLITSLPCPRRLSTSKLG